MLTGYNLKSIKKQNILFPLMFVVFVMWQCAGIFPAISYEGDALSISAGCEYSYKHGWDSLGEKGYGYWMQPLTYVLILAIKELAPSAGCEQIYSILSSIAAIIFQIFTILFVSRLTRLSRSWVLLALFLLPESYALAMYPNSTSLCAALFMAGAWLLINRHAYWGFALLAIAPAFRLDVLVVYPSLPFLLILSGYSVRKSIIYSFLYAIALSAFLYFMYTMLGADILHTASEHSRWGDLVPLKKNLIAIFGFYGLPGLSLLLLSPFLCFKMRNRRKLLTVYIMSWCMLLLVHTIQLRFGNASKHFAMLIPFVTILIATTLAKITSGKSKISRPIILAIFGLTMIGGIRYSSGKKIITQSLLNEYSPTLAKHEFETSRGDFSLVLGGGQAAMTSDEAILTSGNIFYPWFIHRIKEANLKRRTALCKFLRSDKNQEVIYAPWEEMASLDLLSEKGEIPINVSTQDRTLFDGIGNIEEPGSIDNMAAHIKNKYSSRQDRIIFVHTESISHRWEFALQALSKLKIIEPEDSSFTIYKIRHESN